MLLHYFQIVNTGNERTYIIIVIEEAVDSV